MTLNGVMAVILRYFSEFGNLPDVLRKSSRSLSHLLMSSCIYFDIDCGVLCGVKTEKSGAASAEERNFVRSKLLYLSHQKWRSAADVENMFAIHQSAVKAAAGALVKRFLY